MQEIEVKPVGIQTTQATLAGGNSGLAGRILRIDLAHQKDLIASAVERLGNELLGLALAIHLGCIDEGEAEVETEPQGGDLFCSGCRMLPQVPSALAESRHALTRW